MRAVAVFVFLALVFGTVNMDAQLSGRCVRVLHRRQRFASFNCSTVYSKVFLKRVTLLSKYIFTGRVYAVNIGYNDSRTYKVTIRRVLKGDLNDVGVVVKFGAAEDLRFSGASIWVESFRAFKCPLFRLRSYAIFLTEKKRDVGHPQLDLVAEPVPLTLRHVEIIDSAVKGKPFISYLYIKVSCI